MSETVEIVVNGRTVQARRDKPLIHACLQAEEEVPHYCYHPGLSPVGSCRICQVEVKQGEMPPRVMAACRTPVAPGMVVDTEAARAHDARRECLEFLLKNHPLDCPICDKAGECTLQDYSFAEGQGEGQTVEPRRQLEKRKDLGDVIVLDQERCILCSRCVRFMEEVPKTPQLCIGGRGSHSVVETWADRPLEGNYQGNLADVCPVGALTLKKFRFQARVWNLTKTASTCGECSRGCATTVEVLRGGDVKRIRPRHDEAVNGWWMCDTGRFALEPLNQPERLQGGRVRSGSGVGTEPVANEDALEIARDMLLTHERALLVASPWLTVEEGAQLVALGKRLGARPVLVSPADNGQGDDLLHTGDPCPNRKGLTDLGLDALPAEEVATLAAEHDAVVLVGERVAELVGLDAVTALPTSMRVVLLDTVLVDHPTVDLAIGVANCVERAGHWVNQSGERRSILPARQAPQGTWSPERLLGGLLELLGTSTEAAGGKTEVHS